MNAKTKSILSALRDQMKKMADEERVELKHSLMEGYCEDCGSKYLPCHCKGDD